MSRHDEHGGGTRRDGSRYSRQTRLAVIGEAGQRRIAEARVAIVGVGALGTVVADILARAGVGTLVLIDGDCVEESNLQRQVLFTESDAAAGIPKASAACAHLAEINSEVTCLAVVTELDARNAERLLADVDLAIDGTDNVTARRVLNEACHELGIAWVHGAAIATAGEVMTIVPGETPCFACYQPQAPAETGGCATRGVLATTTHLVATLQATEALRLIVGERPTPGVRLVDPWRGFSQTVAVDRRQDCPVCVRGRREALAASAARVSPHCGDGWTVRPDSETTVNLASFSRRLPAGTLQSAHEAVVRFTVAEEGVPEDGAVRVTLFADGRAHVHGVDDPVRARRIYRDYVGG